MSTHRICFLVGSMAISGGTYVIVQHAAHLYDLGYEVTLAVQETYTKATLQWHDRVSTLRCLPFNIAMKEQYDLVIATWWKTALDLGSFDAKHYAYFVQSIESKFYPEVEAPLQRLVESTYNLPVSFVTEATWIQDYLLNRHCKSASLVRNGIRKDIYKADGDSIPRANPDHPRVLIEGPFGVAFKNTALAIRLAKRAGAKDIWVLTSSPVSGLPGVSRVFSRVPMYETAKIYRSCDILVKLSTVEGMFGPPLEMFHCGGTSVVFNVTGHDEYIVNGKNALVVNAGSIDAVVDAIGRLINDRTLLNSLTTEAKRTAEQWPSWDDSSNLFADWVTRCLLSANSDKYSITEMNKEAWVTYERSEKIRLTNRPSLTKRHRMRAMASKWLPAASARLLKDVESKLEVLFGKDIAR